MRSTLILLLGCLPLSVLTVRSFVELGSIDDQLGSPGTFGNVDVGPGLAANTAAQLEADRPLLNGLAEVDLLSGEAPAGLEDVAEQSIFKPLRDTWPQWAAARRVAGEFLQLERRAAMAPGQVDEKPLGEIQGVEEELEELKRSHERSKGEYEDLKRQCQDSPARALGQFLAVVDRRVADLDRRIDGCQKRLEAAATLSDARAAFRPKEYGECVALCDKLLANYSSVLAPSAAAKVGLLRSRAEFRDDSERLLAQLSETDAPSQRAALLEQFLNKHNHRGSRTEHEQRVLDQRADELRQIRALLEAAAAEREAEELIQELHRNLPVAFDQRLRSTAKIVSTYPTDTVKMTIRGNARQWLREFLPEKRITEPPLLQEAETTKGEILRGYFKRVDAPDGSVLGYKRYRTVEDRANPPFDVGTYPKDELLVPPGESVPRRCVKAYEQARNRLFEEPSVRTAWAELTELCESLEAELRNYRKKKGASSADPDLSFAEEARFVREFLAGSSWADLETVFKP